MSEDELGTAGFLLDYLNAARLGDGSLAAGANTLAAMALTISNVARPGVGVAWSADGSRMAVGSGFVMAGSLGSSLVAEHVVGPLMACQSSLGANVCHFGETVLRERKTAEARGRPSDADVDLEHESVPVLREVMRPSMLGREALGKAMRLLDPPPRGHVREIQDHPLVFGNADSPAAFERLMKPAHLGSPLLHVGLHEPGDSQSFANACNRLMDGCHLPQATARTVRGRVMVTDSRNMLEDALRAGHQGAGWLSRLPWLLDDAPDPGFPKILKSESTGRLDKVVNRFRDALRLSLAERLGGACERDASMEYDFGRMQRTWVRFLRGCEPSFPGIAGILRPLFGSLLYGLWRMIKLLDRSGDPNTIAYAVLQFSRLLALRMVNARQSMLRDSERERLEAVAESIRIKLSGGPMTVREVIRRSHRLRASMCEDAFDLLLSRGLVECSGNRWALLVAPTAASRPQPHSLDV